MTHCFSLPSANAECTQMGTVYGQGVWKDLISEFYATGGTTEFMTKAGGLCEQHAAWCKDIAIPLAGGFTGAAQASPPLPFDM